MSSEYFGPNNFLFFFNTRSPKISIHPEVPKSVSWSVAKFCLIKAEIIFN